MWRIFLLGHETAHSTGRRDIIWLCYEASTNCSHSSYTAGKIDGPVGNLKVTALSDLGKDGESTVNGDYGFVVSGKATPEGELYNPEKAEKPHTSGRLYNSMFVRHWDHYVTRERNNLFLTKLKRNTDGLWELGDLKNAFHGTLETPIEPFGGADNFDISRDGLVFTAKDPDLNPALHTKTNIYYTKMWWGVADTTTSALHQVQIAGFEGASTSPVFSPDGSSFMFLSMRTDGYESDKNQIFYVPDVKRPSWVVHAFASADGKGKWDRSPGSIVWSKHM